MHRQIPVQTTHLSFRILSSVCGVAIAGIAALGCQHSAAQATAGGAIPVYNKQTGRLEQLLSDKNGDGKIDTRAHMDGVRLKMIEIDQNADEKADRWEYYIPAATSGATVRPTTSTVIERVEEAGQRNGRITRREFYTDGVIARTEEDSDFDGRLDKWEFYEAGQLMRVDLDLTGRGAVTRRLLYKADGTFDRVEEDPDGDGKFVPLTPAAKGGEAR